MWCISSFCVDRLCRGAADVLSAIAPPVDAYDNHVAAEAILRAIGTIPYNGYDAEREGHGPSPTDMP